MEDKKKKETENTKGTFKTQKLRETDNAKAKNKRRRKDKKFKEHFMEIQMYKPKD